MWSIRAALRPGAGAPERTCYGHLMRRSAATACLLGLVVLSAACGASEGPAAPSETASTATPPAPAPVYDTTTIASMGPLADGGVVGALPASDGSTTALLVGRLPGEETGCEGMPLEGLLAVVGGGEAEPVLDAAGDPVVNYAVVSTPPGPEVGDPVAIASVCEGFTSAVYVGTIGSDGVPADLVKIGGVDADGNPLPDGPQLQTVTDMSWTPDGARLLLVSAPYAYETPPAGGELWSFDVTAGDPGIWIQRTDAPEGVRWAVELGDGTLVVIADDAVLDGGHEFAREGATDILVSPDGQTFALPGENGLRTVGPDGALVQVADGSIGIARFLPDGSGIVFSKSQGATVTFAVVDLETGTVSELGSGDWGWFAPLVDGSGLFVTVGENGMPVTQLWTFALAA